MLIANQLSVGYGQYPLISRWSTSVAAGEILLLRGANGVGKTSLLRVLAGLDAPLSGQVSWLGHSVHQPSFALAQSRVWLGYDNPLHPSLSAADNLQLLQALSPHPERSVKTALAMVGLQKVERKLVSSLSAGMQRRLALASVWLSQATWWVLDEPQTALDAQGVLLFEQMLKAFVQTGGVVVMASHHELMCEDLSVRVCDLSEFGKADKS